MKILNRMTYGVEHRAVTARETPLRIKPYQIIVWVSISGAELLEWDSRTPSFPALLDTGNNHNFSIKSSQLIQWAGIQPTLLSVLGGVRERGQRLQRHEASLWLHSNCVGTAEKAAREPIRLEVDQGIIIYPDNLSAVPSLPLLGLRALTDNQLRALIDGERRQVSIWTKRPRWLPW